MAHYVGLDVSLEETSICAVDEKGKNGVARQNFVQTPINC